MLSLNTVYTFKSNIPEVSASAKTLYSVVRRVQRMCSSYFTVQNRRATYSSVSSPEECYGKAERDFYPLQHWSEDDILHLDPTMGNACVPPATSSRYSNMPTKIL